MRFQRSKNSYRKAGLGCVLVTCRSRSPLETISQGLAGCISPTQHQLSRHVPWEEAVEQISAGPGSSPVLCHPANGSCRPYLRGGCHIPPGYLSRLYRSRVQSEKSVKRTHGQCTYNFCWVRGLLRRRLPVPLGQNRLLFFMSVPTAEKARATSRRGGLRNRRLVVSLFFFLKAILKHSLNLYSCNKV